MKSHIKTATIAILSIVIAFGGLYFAGKYILPDITGSSDVVLTGESKKIGAFIGSRAPAFNLRDMSGKNIRLADFAGAPTIVVFWSTWNKDSADQIKIIDDYSRDYKDRAGLVHIVAINSQEDESVVSSFIRRGGYITSSLLDTFGDVTNLYSVHSLPTFFFIGRDGVIHDTEIGIMSEKVLVEKVENLLKKVSVQ
jgi:peroxiredoxin